MEGGTKLSTLAKYLEGKHWELKKRFRAHIDGNELFNLKFDLPIAELRRLTIERAVYLLNSPEFYENWMDEKNGDPEYINKRFALSEVSPATDLAVGVKMGVMVPLFGGAVVNLGSKENCENFINRFSMRFTGMFCMSERGHGTNVRGIETTAHYDKETQEFIIHTPTPDAAKIFIGNALNGNYAAVFAQLYIDGKTKGPHCFIVPIWTDDGLCPGVHVKDMGMKEGLNGVDNGILSFDHVRIPREYLLSKYADVTPEGVYETSIASDGARFNISLATLVATRLCLCFQAIGPAKVGLEIAVRYAFQRRQHGASGQPEQLIIDYQTHQMRLMPKLATVLATTFATRYATQLLNDDIKQGIPLHQDRQMQALVAGLKAYVTWETIDILQTCRECCGAQGFMEENRLASLKRDADVFVTFEGDNTVLLQQVAKDLLAQYSTQFGGSKFKAVLFSVMETLRSRLQTSFLSVQGTPVTSIEYVIHALNFKQKFLLQTLAARLIDKVLSKQEDPFAAWNDCLDHTGQLSLCYVQQITLQKFLEAVEECPEKADRAILRKFCQLYAMHLLHGERAWLLEQHYMTPSDSKKIRDIYITLCRETKEHALEIVDAFCHPANCVHAPIAGVPNERAPWGYYPRETRSASKL